MVWLQTYWCTKYHRTIWKGEGEVKQTVVIFLVSACVGLGIGYLWDQQEAPAQVATETAPSVSPTADTAKSQIVSAEGAIFQSKGCLSCHAISSLGLKGGATGPDLSQAFGQVEGKHGKPLSEFLKQPTSAVMSSVLGGNPLTDEEIGKVVEALKLASESKK
jgi:cytochrome c551/c552